MCGTCISSGAGTSSRWETASANSTKKSWAEVAAVKIDEDYFYRPPPRIAIEFEVIFNVRVIISSCCFNIQI